MEAADNNFKYSIYLMADGSFQHGKEIEHVMLRMIHHSDLIEMYRKSNDLIRWLQHLVDHDRVSAADVEYEVLILERLQAAAHVRHLPLLHLGCGRKTLVDIFVTIAQATVAAAAAAASTQQSSN